MLPFLFGLNLEPVKIFDNRGRYKRLEVRSDEKPLPIETPEPRQDQGCQTYLARYRFRALSNIKIAYERNVIRRERGMIISSADVDGMTGSMPMDDDEKKEVQADLKTNYGFREGQSQFMVTRHNINVHNIDQDVRKLGLLNEISSDAMVVSERYGVPEVLTKLYMKGATFENQESAERRMYQNTTIPEENDRWEDINNWLKCRDFGFEYAPTFDHIPVLQENKKG